MNLQIKDFFVNNRSHSIGVDEKTLVFGWKLVSDLKNVQQKSYRLIVFDEKGTQYDSGEVLDDNSVDVTVTLPLSPYTAYTAMVSVQDIYGNTAGAETTFETGLLDEEFSADFIAAATDFGDVCPLFFCNFLLKRNVVKARLYATALGLYSVTLNGSRVGDIKFAPYWTSYAHTLQYQTYDVTELLKQGENDVEILVGEGWYKGEITYDNVSCFYGDVIAACAQLCVWYEDGTREILVKTDKGWQCKKSAVKYSSIYHGETLDLTENDDTVYGVKTVFYDKKKIISQINEPVCEDRRVQAKRKFLTPKGECVLDFGENLTGLVEVQYTATECAHIILEHGEVLDKDGNFYNENLRNCRAKDEYILPIGSYVLQPVFTFHGFRYVKVTGIAYEQVQIENFTLVFYHSALRKTGFYRCSDASVNQLFDNIVRSQLDNFLDVPTDCPQRNERLGWTGDANVFSTTACFNCDTRLFFRKWLHDLASEQTAEHGVTHVVPHVIEDRDGASCWGDAATMIPWNIYQFYGNTDILRRQYDSMKGWVDYITSKSEGNLWKCGFHYGDWLAMDAIDDVNIGATDVYFIANAYYAQSAEIVSKAAAVLGKKDDVRRYAQLSKDVKKAFLKEYVTPNGRLVSETQTACLLALWFDMIPKRFVPQTLETLKKKLDMHGGYLTTGFVGTPILCLTLSQFGLHDRASRLLLNRECPSWLYCVDKGATTIWERWDSLKPDGGFNDRGMNSFNHYAYGAIGEWLYKKSAGIESLAAGFKKISINPMEIKGITYTEAAVDTVYGEVYCKTEYDNGNRRITVRIPANTTAEIFLKTGKRKVGSGNYVFND